MNAEAEHNDNSPKISRSKGIADWWKKTVIWKRIALLLLLPLMIGILVATYQIWLDRNWNGNDLPEEYEINVTLLHPDGTRITEGADVSVSSLAMIQKSVGGGFQLVIQAKHLPENGNITVRTYKQDEFLAGQDSLTLSDEPKPILEIKLKEDASAFAYGYVLDSDSNDGIDSVQVSLATKAGEVVDTTNARGYFRLPSYTHPGKWVNLRFSKSGSPYKSKSKWVEAGREVEIKLLTKETM